MSDNEIIFVLRNLCKFGCPAHILGCDLSIKSKEQNSSIIEMGIRTLFRPSEARNELLKWIDSEIWANHSIENGDVSTNEKTHPGTLDLMKGVKTRLSCILSTDTETFFGNKPQDHVSQLNSWMEMLRALQINQKAKEGKSIDNEYQEAKLHMQFLSDQGCALPVSPVIEVNVNGPVKENGMVAKKTNRKGPKNTKGEEKGAIINSEYLLIPRDIEKAIRDGKRPSITNDELQKIRNEVAAEVNLLSNPSGEVGGGDICSDNELEHETPKLLDVIKNIVSYQSIKSLADTSHRFKKIYDKDLKSWVDRTPMVETNPELEDITKKLATLLSETAKKAEATSKIRSSVTGIALKSKELDSSLEKNKTS